MGQEAHRCKQITMEAKPVKPRLPTSLSNALVASKACSYTCFQTEGPKKDPFWVLYDTQPAPGSMGQGSLQLSPARWPPKQLALVRTDGVCTESQQGSSNPASAGQPHGQAVFQE